jgi:hypothetical protein
MMRSTTRSCGGIRVKKLCKIGHSKIYNCSMQKREKFMMLSWTTSDVRNHCAVLLTVKLVVAKPFWSTPCVTSSVPSNSLYLLQPHQHLQHSCTWEDAQHTQLLKYVIRKILRGHMLIMMAQIPVNNNNQLLKSPIQPGHSQAELIRQAAVIIWDEAPMVNKAVFTCVHEVCRKVMENDLPFRGKVVILLGDFHQTCPVIRGGSKVQVINTSIKSSPLWRHVITLGLMAPFQNAQDPEYQQFVDAIGVTW